MVDEEEEIIEEGGSKKGWAIAAIGILIVLAILVIKLTAEGPTDEFMGITNPEGVYGEYFLSGIAIGIIVMIIGGAMGARKKKPVEEEEIDLEEELEEAEEGICPTCGAVIPIDSDECPECGEELEPPEEEIFEEEEEEEELVEQECPICGAEVSGDADECPECGEPLGEEEEEDIFEDL